MKHFYRLILALSLAIASFACATNELDEQIAANTTTTAVPEEIYADFDEESTRVQLDALCRTTWTKGDMASAFYFSDKVSVFRFMGRTGDRSGALQCISQGTGGTAIDKVVLLYPHSESYALNASKGRIGVTIPDVQYYQEGSYGVGANLMASVGEDTKFSLKNLCGWVKVQFVGAGTVSEVTLSGNGYEQVAGDATFYYNDFRLALLGQEDASEDDSELGGSLVFGEYKTTVKLDCGEGIALDPTEPTEFYLVLAPQTFEEGITVTATLTDGTTLTKSTSKPLTVERNHIVPMSPLEVVAQSMREIHYTATEKVEPSAPNAFGANIVSNEWDSATGKGVITFDGAVTKIGDAAFCWYSNLTSITIPDSVTSIGNGAFSGCESLASITIPEGVTSIGDSAFYGCPSLASITIPEGVTSIGELAFYICSSFESITIPNSVTSIGDNAFCDCTSLAEFEGKFASEDGRCLIVDGVLNSFAPYGLTEYTIPDSVTEIGDGAFCNCVSLTSVTIPEGVTSIGEDAFCGCSSLVSISIPEGVTSIGNSVFNGCSSLASITIPEGVTSIGEDAFYGCWSLASITIPDSVTSIGNYAFAACWSLASITIPEGVTSIGEDAFNGCTSLTSITIPDSVTSIGNYAFAACWSLASITIPDSVTKIGDYAFNGCTSLTSITIPDSVTSIGAHAFEYCSSLVSITIPEGVTTIGNYAFSCCSSLAEFNGKFASEDGRCLIVDGVLNSFAPYGLTEYSIPEGVTSIGDEAFYGCSNLASIIIPEGVTSIGESAFAACSSLASITIPEGVTSIEYFAFSYCESLASITIPDSVTEIGREAFNGCSSLAEVYCKPTTPPAGDSFMFYDNASGRKIYVPAESVSAYKSATYWSNYADAIEGYDFE